MSREDRFSISDIRRTGTTLAEDGKAVLVWTFRGKMATLAETADDLSSAGGLGELLANLLFLRRFFVCCGLGGGAFISKISRIPKSNTHFSSSTER